MPAPAAPGNLLRQPNVTQKGQYDISNQSDAENDDRNRGHFDVENMSEVKGHMSSSEAQRPTALVRDQPINPFVQEVTTSITATITMKTMASISSLRHMTAIASWAPAASRLLTASICLGAER